MGNIVMPNGTEQPIAFASHSLSKAELKYAHLDKEGIAIIYGSRSSINICLASNLQYVLITSDYNISLQKHVLFQA